MKRLIPLIAVILLISIQLTGAPELVEKIYAVVNGELITFSELRNAEIEMSRLLAQQYKGEELNSEIKKMKSTLLDRLGWPWPRPCPILRVKYPPGQASCFVPSG